MKFHRRFILRQRSTPHIWKLSASGSESRNLWKDASTSPDTAYFHNLAHTPGCFMKILLEMCLWTRKSRFNNFIIRLHPDQIHLGGLRSPSAFVHAGTYPAENLATINPEPVLPLSMNIILATCTNYAKINNSMLHMHSHVSASFLRFFDYTSKSVNSTMKTTVCLPCKNRTRQRKKPAETRPCTRSIELFRSA